MSSKPLGEAAPKERRQTSATRRLQQQDRAEYLDQLRRQATADQTRSYFAQPGPSSLGQTLLAVKEQKQQQAIPPWRPQRFPHRARYLDRLRPHAPPHQSLRYPLQPSSSSLEQKPLRNSAHAESSVIHSELKSQIANDAAIAQELALQLQADTDAVIAYELQLELQAEADAVAARELDFGLNQSLLLGLPAELRNRVYRYAAIEQVQGRELQIPDHWGNGLLSVSKQIRSEYLPVLRSKRIISAKYLKTITPAEWVELNPHKMITNLQWMRRVAHARRAHHAAIPFNSHMHYHVDRLTLSDGQEEEVRNYAAEQMFNKEGNKYGQPWYRGLLTFGDGEEGSMTFEIHRALLQRYAV